MNRQRYIPLVTGILAFASTSCSSDLTNPIVAPQSGPAFTTVFILEEKVIPDADFDEADADKDGGVCVKDTPSGHLILKDANPATPSQPCPPPFIAKIKTEKFPVLKEWFLEDANLNGTICVKETGSGRFIVKDDNDATASQPCPPAFHLIAGKKTPPHKVPAELLGEADDNGNGQVCLHVADGSGNFIAKDDNLATPSQTCPPSYTVELGKKQADGSAPPAPPAGT